MFRETEVGLKSDSADFAKDSYFWHLADYMHQSLAKTLDNALDLSEGFQRLGSTFELSIDGSGRFLNCSVKKTGTDTHFDNSVITRLSSLRFPSPPPFGPSKLTFTLYVDGFGILSLKEVALEAALTSYLRETIQKVKIPAFDLADLAKASRSGLSHELVLYLVSVKPDGASLVSNALWVNSSLSISALEKLDETVQKIVGHFGQLPETLPQRNCDVILRARNGADFSLLNPLEFCTAPQVFLPFREGRQSALSTKRAQANVDILTQLSILKEDNLPDLLQKGDTFWQMSDFAEARRCFDLAMQLFPNEFAAYYRLGTRMLERGRTIPLSESEVREIEELFSKSVKLDPSRTTAFSKLAELYALAGDRDKSFACLEKHTDASAAEFFRIASTFQHAGDDDGAIETLRSGIRRQNPSDFLAFDDLTDLFKMLEEILNRTGRGAELDAERKKFEEALENCGDSLI